MKGPILTFKPKQVVKLFLECLSDRARDIISLRFGLGKETDKLTLEAIGTKYGITRERVRQIEGFALNTIRKSDEFTRNDSAFDELKEIMSEYGGIVNEENFLDYMAKDSSTQNHIHFLLVLGDHFERLRENDEFHHRWTIDEVLTSKVHASLDQLHADISPEELITEIDIIIKFLSLLKREIKGLKNKDQVRRWLELSKVVSQNPLGEWGLSNSSNVKARGIRDAAYLVLRQHGSPMHFTEVAKEIENKFGKKTHVATCHNELIKDNRFVLVGRGLYALSEWGYKKGIVRDIIHDILKKEGALPKDEIVEKVLKERHVKENTILVNLQNSRYFTKDKKGLYSPAVSK